MKISLRPYDPPFLSYDPTSCRNGALDHQKWCFLDFDKGFEFRTSKAHATEVSCKLNEFRNLIQKSALIVVTTFFQIWPIGKFSYMCLDIMENHTKKRRWSRWDRTTHPFQVMTEFPAEMEPRSIKNFATSILTMYSNSENSKTSATEFSCKSNEFDKLAQKSPLIIVRAIFHIWAPRKFSKLCPDKV